MKNEKSIDVLNKLIEINNDRIEGYQTASDETKESDLKELFSKLSNTSAKCREELILEVARLGGEPIQGTKTTGKFFRAWMDVKAALAGNDRKAILNSCEFGEDVAVSTYAKVLKDDANNLTIEQQGMVTLQQRQIKSDHDTVKALRDQLVEVEQ
jgi:uncharacterized protein (TIGR02284 family)